MTLFAPHAHQDTLVLPLALLVCLAMLDSGQYLHKQHALDALPVNSLLKQVSPTTISAKENAPLENIQQRSDSLLMISVLDVLLVNIQQGLDSLLILSVMGDALQEDFHRRLV